jgi:hypothetical protein
VALDVGGHIRGGHDDDDKKSGGLLDAVNDIIANSGAAGGGPSPIGVPKGYTVQTQRQYSSNYYPSGYSYSAGDYPGARPSDVGTMGPRYFDGNQYAPGNANPKEIISLQSDLAYIGLLAPNTDLIPGDWGLESSDAFSRLLAVANQRGEPWRVTLANMKAQAQGGAGGTSGTGTGGAGSGGIRAGGRYRVDDFGNLVPLEQALADQREPLVIRTTDPRTLKVVFGEAASQLLGEGIDNDQMEDMITSFNDMERRRQQEAYDKQVKGGSVVDIMSPESFAVSQMQTQNPEQVEDYQALQRMQETMQFMSSPAWGVGGS